jgi:hypothetical protein
MQLDDRLRERALALIRELRDPTLPDEEVGVRLDELARVLGYPDVSDLIFHQRPELTDDEIVTRALEYRPFAL